MSPMPIISDSRGNYDLRTPQPAVHHGDEPEQVIQAVPYDERPVGHLAPAARSMARRR